jgi:hypothetical protein
MYLVSVSYSEFPGTDREWTLDPLALSKVNLLVGKNATGKTRTINLIHSLSNLLCGEQPVVFTAGRYEAEFEKGAHRWHYILEFDNSNVTREDLDYDGELVLHRGQGGYGRIVAEEVEMPGGNDKSRVKIKFDVESSRIAAFAKLDDAQHSFLRPLHDWAKSVRLFRLGFEVHPNKLALAVKMPIPFNDRETAYLVPIFLKAQKDFGDLYVNTIISDMQKLGYEISGLQVRQPLQMVTTPPAPGDVLGVAVQEKDLRSPVDQPSISQGMFRALSLLAQVNYYLMSKRPACILVDDIGEGLDFERARSLVELLHDKVSRPESQLQLVMTTNDRFVMNYVPLEQWTVLQRKGNRVHVRNINNSKSAFEEFKFTGLSNFDFFATDFLNDAEEDEIVHKPEVLAQ